MLANRKLINAIGYCFKFVSRFTIYKPLPTTGWWDDDVNSLYPWQTLGFKKGDQVIIAMGRGAGKSYFKEMYEGRFSDEDE